MSRKVSTVCSIAFLMAGVGMASSVSAASFTWTGSAGDNNWNTATNWSGGVPVSANDTLITLNTATGAELSIPAALTVKSFVIGSTAGAFTVGKADETSVIRLDTNATVTTTALSVTSNKQQILNASLVVANTASATTTTAIDVAKGGLIANGNLTMNTATRVQAGGGVVFNGVLSGDCGGGNAAMDVNTGTVTFAGTQANTMTCRVNVATGATLILTKTAGVNAIATAAVNINTNAVLRLDAAEQLGDTVELNLRGGRFNMNGLTETAGKIVLNSNVSTIDLGATSTTGLTVGSMSGGTSVITLTIENWKDGQNYLRSTTAPTAAFLTYTSFAGYGTGAVATLKDGYYYVTPATVPEPASLSVVALSAAGLLWRKKRD